MRDLILILAEIGMRQPEITYRPPNRIHVSHNVPHVELKRET